MADTVYGQGGGRPTVTDGNLVLGRLNAGSFLDGKGEPYWTRGVANAGSCRKSLQPDSRKRIRSTIRCALQTVELGRH
jgi:hypothetical protein